jgi:hypothetical protein
LSASRLCALLPEGATHIFNPFGAASPAASVTAVLMIHNVLDSSEKLGFLVFIERLQSSQLYFGRGGTGT